MKIAVLGDIHANIHALRAALSEAERLECERVYHVGDLIAIGPYPAECVALVRERGVRGVMGNHDALVADGMPAGPTPHMDDEEFRHQHWTHSCLDQSLRDYICSLPYRIDDEIEGVSFTIVHFALGRDGKGCKRVDHHGPEEQIIAAFDKEEADLVCFGHLHRAIDATAGSTRFLGLESLGCSKKPEARFIVIEASRGEYAIMPATAAYDDAEMLRRYETLAIPAGEYILKNFLAREP